MSVQYALFDEEPATDLAAELRRFRFNGRRTEIEERNGIPFYVNEFWTARQRQGHSIHEVSYRACFKPQLPQFFIERLTKPGDTVYDPFMGRGTTAVQAVLMSRTAIGNDINPLSTYFTRPRTAPPSLSCIGRRLDEIDWRGDHGEAPDLLVFYHPDTLAEIVALRAYLLRRDAEGTIDPIDDWIRMVAINRLTGHSPGFFSVYSLPPNQAVSAAAQAKINEKRGQTPPRRLVPDIIRKKSRQLLSDGAPPQNGRATFLTGPAEHTPAIKDGSVDLIVTSPPFLDVVQYAGDNWLRCWFAGLNPAEIKISMHKKAEDWAAFIARSFKEFERIVARGGHVAFEVGDVRGGKVNLEELVMASMGGTAFEPLGVMINDQAFTKTANCWGVSNNSKGTNTNRIVLAQRA